MTQEELKAVFEDTQKQVNHKTFNSKAVTHGWKWRIKELGTDNPGYNTLVTVSNTDTVSAAALFSQLGGKTAVLNMASPTRPGGGVRNGAKAQEECLFRCSDLFKSITDYWYPLKLDEGLYTTNATFFKDKDYKKIDGFHVDVITVAALCLNPNHHAEKDQSILDDYVGVTGSKIRLIFDMARLNKVENLILGAWGCGVYKNNPHVIAELFRDACQQYKGYFKQIDFAVINDHNSVANNYEIFKEIIIT